MLIKWDVTVERKLYGPNGPVANDMKRRGRNGARAAQSRAPVRSGLLQSSIGIRVGGDHRGLYMDLIATARSPRGFPYPVVQEVRRPFMYPAVNAMRR